MSNQSELSDRLKMWHFTNTLRRRLKAAAYTSKTCNTWARYFKFMGDFIWENLNGEYMNKTWIWNAFSRQYGFGRFCFEWTFERFIEGVSTDTICNAFITQLKKFDTKKDKDNKAPTARQVASSFASASVARAAKRPRRRRGGTYSNSVTNTKLLQWERDDFVAAKNGTYMYCAALMKDSYERYGADGEFAQGYQTVHEFVTNSNINKACTELMNGVWSNYSLSSKWMAFYDTVKGTGSRLLKDSALQDHIVNIAEDEDVELFRQVMSDGFKVEQTKNPKPKKRKSRRKDIDNDIENDIESPYPIDETTNNAMPFDVNGSVMNLPGVNESYLDPPRHNGRAGRRNEQLSLSQESYLDPQRHNVPRGRRNEQLSLSQDAYEAHHSASSGLRRYDPY
eukprot:691350_1